MMSILLFFRRLIKMASAWEVSKGYRLDAISRYREEYAGISVEYKDLFASVKADEAKEVSGKE